VVKEIGCRARWVGQKSGRAAPKVCKGRRRLGGRGGWWAGRGRAVVVAWGEEKV